MIKQCLYQEEYESFLAEQNKTFVTIESYVQNMITFYHWLSYKYPEIELHQISRTIITEYLKSSLNDNEVSTVNKKITILRSYFNFLWEKGVIGLDPCAKLKRYKESKHTIDDYYLTRDQVDTLWQTIHFLERGNKHYYRTISLISLFLEAGLRASEARNLLWRDIIVKDNTAIITVSGTKARRIIISGLSVKWLHNHQKTSLENHIFVFPGKNGGAISDNYITAIFQSLSTKLPFSLKPQKLRNTFIVQKLEEGHSWEEVAEMIGVEKLVIPNTVLQLLKNNKHKTC